MQQPIRKRRLHSLPSNLVGQGFSSSPIVFDDDDYDFQFPGCSPKSVIHNSTPIASDSDEDRSSVDFKMRDSTSHVSRASDAFLYHSEIEDTFTFDGAKSTTPRHEKKAVKSPSRMFADLQGHNREREKISLGVSYLGRHRVTPPKSKKKKRTSLMVRELASYNKHPSPPPKPAPFVFRDEKTHLTRGARKNLGRIAQGLDIESGEDLNLRHMSAKSVRSQENQELSSNPERWPKPQILSSSRRIKLSSYRRTSQPNIEISDSIAELTQVSPLQKLSSPSGGREIEASLQDGWADWKDQKKSIEAILGSSHYLSSDSLEIKFVGESVTDKIANHTRACAARLHDQRPLHGSSARRIPKYHPIVKLPKGYGGDNLEVVDGVCIFKPSAAIFADFEAFLETVEDIAGRELGVVKVVVPAECTGRYSMLDRSTKLKALKMQFKPTASSIDDTSSLYDCRLVPPKFSEDSFDLLENIHLQKQKLLAAMDLDRNSESDLWSIWQSHISDAEQYMLDKNARCDSMIYYAPRIEATPEIRASLYCRNIGLETFTGNLLTSSSRKDLSINTPSFQISFQAGTPSPMRLSSLGAYTLSFHHRGAPQTWTIVAPTHHNKLEQLMHKAHHGLTHENLLPTTAPSCTQFAQHTPLYIPTETLKLRDIDFTTVVQQEGELVIVFPYAYHQTFHCGLNITESIPYASDRWTVFHRKGLCKPCSDDCSLSTIESFYLDPIIDANNNDPFRIDDSDTDTDTPSVTPSTPAKRHSPRNSGSFSTPTRRQSPRNISGGEHSAAGLMDWESPSSLRTRRLKGRNSGERSSGGRYSGENNGVVLGRTRSGKKVYDMNGRKPRGRVYDGEV